MFTLWPLQQPVPCSELCCGAEREGQLFFLKTVTFNFSPAWIRRCRRDVAVCSLLASGAGRQLGLIPLVSGLGGPVGGLVGGVSCVLKGFLLSGARGLKVRRARPCSRPALLSASAPAP